VTPLGARARAARNWEAAPQDWKPPRREGMDRIPAPLMNGATARTLRGVCRNDRHINRSWLSEARKALRPFPHPRFQSGCTVLSMMCVSWPITCSVEPTISGSGGRTLLASLFGSDRWLKSDSVAVYARLWGNAMIYLYDVVQGFSNSTPVASKSFTLRVTTTMPWTSAVAAIIASCWLRRSGT
jgi:hypothetical protein